MLSRLCAKWVLGHEGGDHVLIRDAEIAVDAGRIVHVGPRRSVDVGSAIDYGDALLAPGFVDLNALGDIDGTILKFDAPALAPDASTWSRSYVESGTRDVLDEDDRVFGAMYSLAEALRNGITTALPVTSLLHRAWHETEREFDLIAEAGRRLGLRLYLGPSFRSAVNVVEADGRVALHWDRGRGEAGLSAALRFAERWRKVGDDLVHPLLVPSTIETCDPALLRATAQAARANAIPFRLHCCQSRREAEFIQAAHGTTSIGLLAQSGALGTLALLPHAVILGGPTGDPRLIEADIDAIARSGSVVVNCPVVLARGGRALNSFGDFRRRGIRIGLGTDTAPADMLMNMQVGLMTARMTGPRVGPADYMRAATLGGADALGRSDLGRLQAGARADIVVFDLGTADTGAVHDPVQALFIAPTGRRVRDVWVGGRRVVTDGAVDGFDHADARHRANRLLETMRAAYSDRDAAHRPWPEIFPPSFPIRDSGSASSA